MDQLAMIQCIYNIIQFREYNLHIYHIVHLYAYIYTYYVLCTLRMYIHTDKLSLIFLDQRRYVHRDQN